MHAYTHTYMHAYTHTYMHAYTQPALLTNGLLRALQIAVASCNITEMRMTSEPLWSKLKSEPEDWLLTSRDSQEEGGERCESLRMF